MSVGALAFQPRLHNFGRDLLAGGIGHDADRCGAPQGQPQPAGGTDATLFRWPLAARRRPAGQADIIGLGVARNAAIGRRSTREAVAGAHMHRKPQGFIVGQGRRLAHSGFTWLLR